MTTPAKRAEQLAALPSLSHALSSLPQARSLDHVALHHPTLAQRGPESEAKLRKALSVNSQNSANGQNYNASIKPQSVQQNGCQGQNTALMMRSKKITRN
ncbi:hypothetical protein PNOK_0621600 [Pyrrhoderma noxium]|uniref:Uncharacterized protein n=1 Tax=Pyrrhoderma noxium TaxID=2282107 RepID=A0A286UDR7_9AGAM|nr:hypothetical protein PNOK_0621600 [Pyrrhoderma noxium]